MKIDFELGNVLLSKRLPQLNQNRAMPLDKYDFVILDIIQSYKKNNRNELIKLTQLETAFWSRIEQDDAQTTRSAQIGERIAALYLDGYIMNKPNQGYRLTKRGKEELSYQEFNL